MAKRKHTEKIDSENAPAPPPLLQKRPTASTCIECAKCDRVCPMNLPVMESIKSKTPVNSADCVQCDACVTACPIRAIQ